RRARPRQRSARSVEVGCRGTRSLHRLLAGTKPPRQRFRRWTASPSSTAVPSGATKSWSRLYHHPASAAEVAYHFLAELLADRVDQDINSIALDLLAPAVETLLELRPRHYPPRPFHQGPHQRELSRRQHDLCPPIAQPVGIQV